MSSARPAGLFKRIAPVVACPPVLFSLSSLCLLGSIAWATPTLLAGIAVGIAAAATVFAAHGAWRGGRTFEMPYLGQAANYMTTGVLTAAILAQEKGAVIVQHFSTQPFLEALVALCNDQPLMHMMGLAIAYGLGTSGALLKIDEKKRAAQGLSPSKKYGDTEMHWSLADVFVNITSLPALATGITGFLLALQRKPEHDDIKVRNCWDLVVKHATPLRLLGFSYVVHVVTKPLLLLADPFSAAGYLLDAAGSFAYDGDDRNLNKDLRQDMHVALPALRKGIVLASALAIASPAHAISNGNPPTPMLAPRYTALQPQ